MPLSDTKIRSLKIPGKHFDGGGLYLEITPAGGRYWRQKYRFAGKEKRLAFGVHPDVSLKDARRQRDEARKLLSAGIDPGAEKQARKLRLKTGTLNTLEAVSGSWIAHFRGKWSESHEQRTLASLQRDVFPILGSRPIGEITATEAKALIQSIEGRGVGEHAARILMRLKSIFRYAVVSGLIDANPIADLKPSDILKPRRVQNRAALPPKELPEFLRRLESFSGDVATREGLRLVLLTAARPGEARGARWEEFDLEAAVWRIPAARMKMRTEHVVPLSRQAISCLGLLKSLQGSSDLVLPSPYHSKQPISENTFNSALSRMGFKGIATAHGFRSLFSTVANESGWTPDAIERQLAHQERNKIRAAYHRSQYLQERAKMMQWWADELEAIQLAKSNAIRPPAIRKES